MPKSSSARAANAAGHPFEMKGRDSLPSRLILPEGAQHAAPYKELAPGALGLFCLGLRRGSGFAVATRDVNAAASLPRCLRGLAV